jgi:hypothetical protein
MQTAIPDEKLLDLDALPDSTLIPRKKVAKILNVSVDTVDNLFEWGLLDRIHVSPRRVCTTVRSIRKRIGAARS